MIIILYYIQLITKNNYPTFQKMALWLRIFITLAEDLGLILNTHVVAHKCL